MLDILQSLCYDIDMNEIKLCKNGHERTPENLSTNRNCIICMKENGKRWYFNNIEKDKERKNKWRLNNTEKEKEINKQRYSNNPEKVKERAKQWQQNNPEKAKQSVKKYAKANPEKVLINNQKHRALKLNQFVSKVIPSEIFKRDNFICMLCNKPLDMKTTRYDPLYPSIDHIIPLSKGGLHCPENVQAAHYRCNCLKGNRN